ncbi:N-acetylmuramoyl-L-alanine amidase [Bacillus niameyensis]|uniref:N-acetylmuramoyl-L-alanine amidase n=1 Tax=Bacillus niameyensis TaxID=1522308 RepID=UPI00078113B8|nr:N-acetylmuramoyl-L-alanine amidase [Bacillus niameyensis]
MPKIIQKIIPKSQTRQRPGYAMTPKYITVHNTANASKGANAEMHARYLLNGAGGRTASWHFTVDDKEIYQHLPLNENGWHAGDGNGAGNRQSIGIEICENSDGNFEQAVKNAQWLISKLIKDHNIPKGNILTHKHWSGKNCPHKLLTGWAHFIGGIGAVEVAKEVSKPKEENKPSKTATEYKGNSIVDYLNSKKIDSSFSNRKKLATQYGVKNYKGTAAQNIELLNKMKGGSAPKVEEPANPKPKGDQKTNSIVDYLKSIKVVSSYANRKKLAAKHGIKNYRGTATQNSQLLKKLRG